MKQNASVIAILMIFLAFFGITNLPQGSTAGDARVAQEQKPKLDAKAKSKAKPDATFHTSFAPDAACDEIRFRLLPFVADGALDDKRLPITCYDKQDAAAATNPTNPEVASLDMNFVVAMVPDPISTHLPLLFDRTIEVIQQAAQDDGYSYDTSWFPWNESSKDSSSDGDQGAAAETQYKQQEQPGVLVFRRSLVHERDASPYDHGLIVFVVAEQPTGGINLKEFSNALLWMEQLGDLRPERFLGILGPTFSGSIPSLARAITSQRLNAFHLKGTPVRISSGSVSSKQSYEWFNNYLKELDLGWFETALEADSLLVNRFCQYVKNQGYDLSRVALISEDETAFGATGELCYDPPSKNVSHTKDVDHKKRQGPVYLYYPRDIATLRSAYEQQSIFRSKSQPSSGTPSSSTLRGDLSEPASSQHDTVRIYGGQLTPLAQESVLQSMTSVLRDKRIEFIVLRSTNSLDQIFLSQFFRQAYPEARVVIDGADLLFRRGAEGSSLRGVMMLSTYPLLTWQQDWTPSLSTPSNELISGESYRIFEEDVGEGLYVAARELFRNRTGLDDPPIWNYAPPTWTGEAGDSKFHDNQRPATWVSVIGHHQFWPVAVLDPDTLGNTTDDTILLPPRGRGDTPGSAGGQRPPMRFPVEFVILLMICIVWSFLHLLWCSRGSISPVTSPFRLTYFAPLFRPQHSALIAFGSLLPMLAAISVAATSGVLTWDLGNWRGTVLVGWALGIFGSSFLACRMNYKLPPLAAIRKEPCAYPAKWQRLAVTLVTLFLVAFALPYVALVYGLKLRGMVWIPGLSAANSIPTYWRSVHLLSGVSGLVPQLLLIAGLYVWFWCSLRGLALFGKDRPLLPELSDLTVACATNRRMPTLSRQIAAGPVEVIALPLGKPYWRVLAPAILLTATVFALVLQGFSLRTLGEKQFGFVMFCWLSLCIGLLLADTAQLWMTWKALRPLLMDLNRLPLRRTLSALKGLSWGSIWAMSGNSLDQRYCIVSRQFESLRHLENSLRVPMPDSRLPGLNKDPVLNLILVCHDQGKELANWYTSFYSSVHCPATESMEPLRKFQEVVASTAGLVMTTLLIPAWQQETESLILDKARLNQPDSDKAKATDADHESASSDHPDLPRYVLAAEEFFLLPYMGFIQIFLGASGPSDPLPDTGLFLFIATTFAVSSYPLIPCLFWAASSWRYSRLPEAP